MKTRKLLVLSIFSGILLSLSWLNTSGLFLLVAFIPLLYLEDKIVNSGKKPRVFWRYSFLAMLVWNSCTTWWIWNATPSGSVMAILVNTLLMSGVLYLFHRTRRVMGKRLGYLALMGYWVSLEYLHLNWEIAWPWLNLGNGFANDVKLVQWYEYTGTLGGTIWVLSINFLLYKILSARIKKKSFKSSKSQIIQAVFLIALPILFSVFTYFKYEEEGDAVEVVVLQPNIDPYNDKFDPKKKGWQTEVLIRLADSLTTPNTSFVIAPETALHGIWENNVGENRYSSIRRIKELIRKNPQASFLTGASSYKWFEKGETLTHTARPFPEGDGYYEAYNAAFLLDSTSNIQKYHKSKLVVGVENMPFTRLMKFIEMLAIDLGGTTGSLGRQKDRTNFKTTTGIKAAPGICYESIFGEFMGKYVFNGANFIAVITNDGWWKNTPGHRQHLSFSRLRAIETRKSIARSANTGISAFINQRGDITQKTGWWEPDALRGEIRINSKLTFYAVWGDYIGRILAFVSVLIFIAAVSKVLRRAKG